MKILSDITERDLRDIAGEMLDEVVESEDLAGMQVKLEINIDRDVVGEINKITIKAEKGPSNP